MKILQYLLFVVILLLSVVLILLADNNVACVSFREDRGIDLETNLCFLLIYSFLFLLMVSVKKKHWMQYLLPIIIFMIVVVTIVNYCKYPFVDGYYDSNSLTLHYFNTSDPQKIIAGIEDYFINLIQIIILGLTFLISKFLIHNKKSK